jgi:hypothetical protein
MGSFSLFHWLVVGVIGFIAYLVLRPKPKSTVIAGPGSFELDIVGESHFQETLGAVAGGKTEEGVSVRCEATLVLDDANIHDKKAVRVEIAGRTVGHLSRENAHRYRAGTPAKRQKVHALIVGGWDRGRYDEGLFGVKLDYSL